MSTAVAYTSRGTPFETSTLYASGAPTAPSGVAVGDLLMLVAMTGGYTTDPTNRANVTRPGDATADWEEINLEGGVDIGGLVGDASAVYAGVLRVWWRIADGTAADTPPSITFQFDGDPATINTSDEAMVVEAWRIINPDERYPFGAVPNFTWTTGIGTGSQTAVGSSVYLRENSLAMAVVVRPYDELTGLGDFATVPGTNTQWVDNILTTGVGNGCAIMMETVPADAYAGQSGDYTVSYTTSPWGVLVMELIEEGFDGPSVEAEYTIEIGWEANGLIIGEGVIGDGLMGIGYQYPEPLDDDFEDRTNGDLVGQGLWIANVWTDPTANVLDGKVRTNAAAGSWRGAEYAQTYSYGKLRVDLSTFPTDDRYVELYHFINPPTSTMACVAVRTSGGVPQIIIMEYVGGVPNNLTSWTNISVGSRTIVEAEFLPDAIIKAYVNGVQILQATHNVTFTSGYIGIDSNSAAMRIDAVEFTELTDVTADAENFNIRRGRDDPQSTISSGTCDITLYHEDGRYNPENTSSPLYGCMLPMRDVRIRATFQGTTYGLFRGVIRSLEFDPVTRRTTIRAEDLFLRLSRVKPVIDETTAGTTGSLINDILEAALTPSSLIDVDTTAGDSGFTFSMAGTSDSRTALQGIADLLEAERGIFYCDKDGRCTYRERYVQQVQPSQFTLDNVFQSYIPGVSLENVVNTARVTKTDGEMQEVTNVTSEDLYGPADLAIESPYFEDDTAALALANFLVFQLATPRNPVWELPFVANFNADVMTCVLAAEILNRITITNEDQPGLAGDYYIESMTHSVQRGALHNVTWALSRRQEPGEYFVLGSSTLGGGDILAYY